MGAADSRHPGVEVGLVLEEVEVSPFFVSDAVNGIGVAVALGARLLES